jgi:hypothetical protein
MLMSELEETHPLSIHNKNHQQGQQPLGHKIRQKLRLQPLLQTQTGHSSGSASPATGAAAVAVKIAAEHLPSEEITLIFSEEYEPPVSLIVRRESKFKLVKAEYCKMRKFKLPRFSFRSQFVCFGRSIRKVTYRAARAHEVEGHVRFIHQGRNLDAFIQGCGNGDSITCADLGMEDGDVVEVRNGFHQICD